MKYAVLAILVALVACKKKEEPASTAAAGVAAALAKAGSGESAAPAPTPTPEPAAAEGPLRLDEDRLQKYVAFRHELHKVRGQFMQDITRLGHGKSQPGGPGAGTLVDLAEIGKKHGDATKALRDKHGFPEREDNRLWTAISEVTGAKTSENPMMESTLKMYREWAKGPGPQKKMADDFLKKMEENERTQLEKARTRFGDEAVKTISAHVKDLHELQMEGMKAAFGGTPGAPTH